VRDPMMCRDSIGLFWAFRHYRRVVRCTKASSSAEIDRSASLGRWSGFLNLLKQRPNI
jgi:hypothetical protein